MASNTVDIADYPAILTMMAYRPSPNTIARWVCQPDFVQDTNLRPGEVYQMNKWGYLPDLNDQNIENRTRSDQQLIGTANTRVIPNEKVNFILREITGPGSGDPNSPSQPGNFRFSIPAMRKAQENLWQQGVQNPCLSPQFHDSIGANTLLMDYRTTTDRFYIYALLNTPNKLNPQGIADGGTYASGPPKLTVEDADFMLEWLYINKVPVFEDGLYHWLMHPKQFNHLRQDPRFREQLQSSAAFAVGMLMALQNNVFGAGYMPPAQNELATATLQSLTGLRDPLNQPNIGYFYPYLGQALPGVDNAYMQGGYVFNQFRIFITNNIPTKNVLLTYTASTDPSELTGSQLRTAFPGAAFGRHAIGELFGGSPDLGIPVEILANQNNDYKRFLIVIWQAFMDVKRIHDDFVMETRTYGR